MVQSKALVAIVESGEAVSTRRSGERDGGGDGSSMALTFVVKIVCGSGEDLEGTSKVEHVEVGLEGKEDVNGFLVSHRGGLVCSHLERCLWTGAVCVYVV